VRFFLAIFLLTPVAILQAQSDGGNGHVDFGTLSAAEEALFLNSVRDGTLIEVTTEDTAGSAAHSAVWRTVPSTVTAEVTNARLLFSRKWREETRSDESSPHVSASPADDISTSNEPDENEYFYLFIAFHENGIEFKSSRSGLESPEPGLKLVSGERRIAPLSIVPTAGVRLVLLAPRFADAREAGLLLCPRVYRLRQAPSVKPDSRASVGPTPVRRAFLDAGYRLGSVRTEVSGSLRGKIVGGFGPARAAGEILTSPDIARSRESRDQTFSRDPALSMDYVPEKEDPLQTFDDLAEPVRERASGIESELTLQNAAGYEMVEQVSEVLRIKEIAFPPVEPIRLNPQLDSGGGVCYLIHKQHRQVTVYTKRPLVVPERLVPESSSR